MAEHNELGKRAENIAHDYLISRDYEILERNYRHNNKELDIIAQDKNNIVFVEVKGRTTNSHENIADMINNQKQEFLLEAADFYIRDKKIDAEARFDVIFVNFYITGHTIKHVKNAFQPKF